VRDAPQPDPQTLLRREAALEHEHVAGRERRRVGRPRRVRRAIGEGRPASGLQQEAAQVAHLIGAFLRERQETAVRQAGNGFQPAVLRQSRERRRRRERLGGAVERPLAAKAPKAVVALEANDQAAVRQRRERLGVLPGLVLERLPVGIQDRPELRAGEAGQEPARVVDEPRL
jgi:hypothetical protein